MITNTDDLTQILKHLWRLLLYNSTTKVILIQPHNTGQCLLEK